MLLVQQHEAEGLLAAGSQDPVAATLAWMRGYVAQPNPSLGRPGSVCPFVPKALRLSCLWFGRVPFVDLNGELQQLKEEFFLLDPTDADRKIGKTVVLIVEDMPDKYLLEGEWLVWLAAYLEVGLKITAFHPKHLQQGMHNPAFLSHVSPYPLLAIRHLHARDSAFVAQLVGTKEGELLAAGHARLFKT